MSHSINCRLIHTPHWAQGTPDLHRQVPSAIRHAAPFCTFAIGVLASMLCIPVAQADGNADAGKAAWYRTCERCHGNPTPHSKNAFSDYGTTANSLSVYASDPAAITRAANEGYTIPAGNTNDKVPVGGNSRMEMGSFAGMAPDRLGYGTTPTQYAIDISAYFASLFAPPAPPQITGISPGDRNAIVSFTGAQSALPVHTYTVTADPGGIMSSGTGSPLTLSKLLPGTSYTINLTATSNAGSSKPSANKSLVTLATPGPIKPDTATLAVNTQPVLIPPAQSNATAPSFDLDGPTILRARAGNGQAKVYFTMPPASASVIADYTVYAAPRDGATEISVQGNKSPITVPGLRNGTDYTFTVVARTGDKRVLRSAPSATITPLAILGD